MKKVLFLLFSIFFFSIFIACASTEEQEEEEKIELPKDNTHRVSHSVYNAENEAKLFTINQSGIDDMIKRGWKPVEKESGVLKISAKGNLGTYNIYVIDRDGNYIPVFSTAEEFTGTSLYLQAGKRVYKLSGGSGTEIAARETPNGVQLVYRIPKVAQVFVNLTIFSSNEQKSGDMIKMTSCIKNNKGRKDNFALKFVMDTVIGEKTKYHFYSSNNKPVVTENLYRFLGDNRWFITGNDTTSFQIIFQGADCSTPEFTSIANFETLNTLSWEPAILTTRSFDTVSSYNNSAICVAWPSVTLEPEQQSSFNMYFATATFPESISSGSFLNEYNSVHKKTGETEVIKANSQDSDNGKIVSSESTVLELSDDGTSGIYNEKEKRFYSDIDFSTLLKKDSPFSAEYMQRLLNRISEIEESGKDFDEEELLLLNEEFDEILKQLRGND